jgi:tyrosyl-tRNA synthetase
VAQGGVYVNNAKVEDADQLIGSAILPGDMVVLRRGKKTLAGVFVVPSP